MSRSYYGDKISKNLIETPEGYLICKNVPLARTGWMDYKGSELPEEFNEPPNKICKVYRSPEEVFSPATIASFEGKPVTNTHPLENLTIDSVDMSERGHSQDIRQDGNYLIGDLHIRDGILKSDILNDIKREISCGYDCAWVPLGEGKYEQKGIVGNHIAVVANGRAGHRVKINDALPEGMLNIKGGKMQMSKVTQKILTAIGFQHWAKDADPEEVAEAMQTMQDEATQKPAFLKEPGNDVLPEDKVKDEKPDKEKEPVSDDKAVKDDKSGDDNLKTEEKPVKDDATGTAALTPDAMQLILAKMDQVLGRVGELEAKLTPKEPTADENFAGLEGELGKKVADEDMPAEASVTDDDETKEDPKLQQGEENEAQDADGEKDKFAHAVADSALKKFVTDMKPVIMGIKDEKTRNSVAKAFVGSVRDARQVGDGQGYANIMQTVNKNKSTAMDNASQHRSESMSVRAQKTVDAWKARGAEMQNKGGK